MVSKKIAMLGMWGVGKTSLVQQFVNSIYDEKYHATLGVKVDKKVVDFGDGGQMNLMMWDIAGAEDHFSIPLHYVRGAAGYLLVIDGTRRETLDRALDLVTAIEDGVGSLPFVTVVNKSDLEWEITDADLGEKFAPLNSTIYKSSAKTGENVETAFLTLAGRL